MRAPASTPTTSAPSSRIRSTFGRWRRMSSVPMYTVQSRSSRAHAVAAATPCCPAPVSAIARRTGAKVIKAQSVRLASDVISVQAFHTDFHLLDTHRDGLRGGTGETFDWELARLHPGTPPVVLSGGLDPDNVGAAIETARPFAVDVASGTEAAPGRKDPAKLTAFVRAVEEADARLGALA